MTESQEARDEVNAFAMLQMKQAILFAAEVCEKELTKAKFGQFIVVRLSCTALDPLEFSLFLLLDQRVYTNGFKIDASYREISLYQLVTTLLSLCIEVIAGMFPDKDQVTH